MEKEVHTYRMYNGIIDNLHNKLIEFIVGKKPVMLNMKLETESSIGINNPYVLWVNNTIDNIEGTENNERYYSVFPSLSERDEEKIKKLVKQVVNELLES